MTAERKGGMDMDTYIVECSECRYHYQGGNADAAKAKSEEHENVTRHRGPFVWRLTAQMRALLARS